MKFHKKKLKAQVMILHENISRLNFGTFIRKYVKYPNSKGLLLYFVME